MITDPPTTSSTTLKKERRKKKEKRKRKKWHMTCDMWHVTWDIWRQVGGWTVSQKFSSLALTVWERQCFEDIFTKDDWASKLVSVTPTVTFSLSKFGVVSVSSVWCLSETLGYLSCSGIINLCSLPLVNIILGMFTVNSVIWIWSHSFVKFAVES